MFSFHHPHLCMTTQNILLQYCCYISQYHSNGQGKTYGLSQSHNAKVTCQSNIKSEPVDKQPAIKEEPEIKSEPLTIIKEPSRFLAPPPAPPFISGNRVLAPFWAPPPARPPAPAPPPPPTPPHRALPPRTTRADFITPDQRAIFGPPVQPKERTDRYVFSEFFFPLLKHILSPKTCIGRMHSLDVFHGSLYPLRQARLTP